MLVLDRAVADVRAPDGRMEVISENERKEGRKETKESNGREYNEKKERKGKKIVEVMSKKERRNQQEIKEEMKRNQMKEKDYE